MPTTKTGYWVRVEDGKVKDVWDTTPDNRPGWKEAVEIHPDISGRDREIITGHTIDITKTPVEIVYSKRDVSAQERIDSYVSHARIEYEMVVREQEMRKNLNNPEMPFDQDAIDAAAATRDARIAALEACTTHDEIDALDA